MKNYNLMSLQAWRIRSCITLRNESATCGKSLFAPITTLDDALLIAKDGIFVHVDKYNPKNIPIGLKVEDLGEKTLVPTAINAHTHLQLSHLKGKTLWGQGFVPWLKSLIPLLPFSTHDFEKPELGLAIANNLNSMKKMGTSAFVDYTSGAMHIIAKHAYNLNLNVLLLAEWFGFTEDFDDENFLPKRSKDAYSALSYTSQKHTIACGHALYSTAAITLQKIKTWCNFRQMPFSMHLAEFPEEVQALTQGNGFLVDLYKENILPKNWKAPGMSPVKYAQQLGLLDEKTLAIHCVQCSKKDIAILEENQCTICLCPRSNANLGVGVAPFQDYLKRNIYLCLGTDGLSSNSDLNVWQEAIFLHEKFDFPWETLLRMLCINASKCLNFPNSPMLENKIIVGANANFTFLPDD